MSLRMPEHLWLCAHCRRGLDSGDNPARWVRRAASSGGLLLLQMAGLVVLATAVAARACEFGVEWLRRCPRRVLSMREACQQIQRCVACAARISLLQKAAAWRVTYNRRPQHQEWLATDFFVHGHRVDRLPWPWEAARFSGREKCKGGHFARIPQHGSWIMMGIVGFQQLTRQL